MEGHGGLPDVMLWKYKSRIVPRSSPIACQDNAAPMTGCTRAPGPQAMGGVLGWVLGCAVQLQQPSLWPGWAYAVVAGLVALAAPAIAARSRGGWVVGLAIAAGLGFASTGWRAVDQRSWVLAPALEGRDLVLTGRIDSLPQAVDAGQRFAFAVASAQMPGQTSAHMPGPAARSAEVEYLAPALARLRRVQLAWYGASPDRGEGRTPLVLRAGDRWSILVRLKAPHGLANPWGPDAELAAWERGVQAWGYVRSGPRDPPPLHLGLASLGSGGGALLSRLDRLRQSVRDAILARVEDRGAAGVLAALVVGDQGAILPSDWTLFRDTGIAHLVSISGLHVTVFAWAAALAVGALWRRSPRLCEACPAPQAAVVGGLLLAGAYAAFSGGGVPARRTLGMLAVAGLLRLSGQRWPWPVTWSVVAAAITAWDPWALLQPGFWLSFVAVGVLFASAPLDAGAREGRGQSSPLSSGVSSRLSTRALALLREQGVVTLALTPLTLLLFGQVSLVGLLANLVAIPWMTCVVLPLALAGALWQALWLPAAWAVQGQAWLLQAMASWPGAVLALPTAPFWMAAAALAGGVLAVLRLPPRLRVAGLLFMLPLLLWRPPRPPPGEFELLAIDIGQGQAVLVRTAGHALLYDAGPRWSEEQDAGQRVLAPGLRALGVRLDRLVVSHPDTDHAGGAAAVLASQPDADLLASLPAGHALAASRPPQACLAGQRWTWDGVRFEVLHPRERDFVQDPGLRQPNAHSCVLRIVAGDGASSLLAGDLESPQELRLAREGLAKVDYLLVPHHGSRTSSSAPWLDALRPRVAVVQAGYRNRYGHPAPAVMARYAERGIPVYTTPTCGAARWLSRAPGVVDCHRLQARRYWWHQPAGPGVPDAPGDLPEAGAGQAGHRFPNDQPRRNLDPDQRLAASREACAGSRPGYCYAGREEPRR